MEFEFNASGRKFLAPNVNVAESDVIVVLQQDYL